MLNARVGLPLLLSLAWALPACIQSGTPSASGDTEDAGAGGAANGADAQAGHGSGGERPPVGGGEPGSGGAAADAGTKPLPPDAGANTPDDRVCDALCERIDACFPEACPILDATPSAIGLCELCATFGEDDARKLAGVSCDELNAVIFGARPELRESCAEGQPPPVDERCGAACEHMEACGLTPMGPNVPADCASLCAGMPPMLLDCLTRDANCDSVGQCLRGVGPGPGPGDAQQQCGNLCRRTARCISTECAPGTLPAGYEDTCVMTCVGAPPTQEELRAFAGSTCEDIVASARRQTPEIDARCDASPEDACTALCRERVVPCNQIGDQAACVAACAGFDAAQLQCVQAQGCDTVAACFDDPAVLDRCGRFCERIEGCLLEACPPRVIPPELSVNCTAGCLVEPPDEMQVQMTEAAMCSDVRRLVYRNNRELAPICEGGGDFRPTPDECAAFCDNGLEACLGVGGRGFCLAGCASMTRDQYACALAAQGECGAIDACLSAP
jgi:hypothetical protein